MPHRFRAAFRAAAFPLLCISAIALAAPALGQDTFRLDEQDDWVQSEAPEAGSPEAQLAAARRTLVRGDAGRARTLADQWIDRNPRDALLPEAYVLRGDALVALDDEYEALFDYELVARRYPGSEAFIVALEREFVIARLYANGMRRKIWGLRVVDAADEAEELLIRVQERLPGSRLAEEAGIELGDFYFKRGEMRLAADAYELFIENYPQSEQLPKARRRLIHANLSSFKGPSFDPTGLYEARSQIRDLKRNDPITAELIAADGLLLAIEERDAFKLLHTANWYRKTGDDISAERLIRRLLRTYPNTAAAADALRMIPELLDDLPEHVRATTPDYDAYRHAILGIAPPEPAASPASPDTPDTPVDASNGAAVNPDHSAMRTPSESGRIDATERGADSMPESEDAP